MGTLHAFDPRREPREAEDPADLHVRTLGSTQTDIGQESFNEPKLRTVDANDRLDRSSTPISIDNLYRTSEVLSPELASALRLLNEGIGHLDAAIEAIEDGDTIAADDILNRLDLIMPELFCCRALGEGYGAIINSAMNSLRNRGQQPLNTIQIRALWLTLKQLRAEPFIRFDKALDLIEGLEKVDLNLDPPGFEQLVEWIDE